MKPNKKENLPDNQKTAAAVIPLDAAWKPSWAWHLKVLAGVYVVLGIAYFAVSAFLRRVPPPYHMREIPPELTPWIKK